MEIYYNRSYNYALPMLDWWDSEFLVNSQLRGCFIGDQKVPDLNSHIFLLYRYTGERWWEGYDSRLTGSPHYIDSYEVDKFHTMYVFEVPEWHVENYLNFRDGKYSKFTDEFKKYVIEFHGKDRARDMIEVMYKHEKMFKKWETKINEGLPLHMWTKIPRDGEASDELHMDREVYDNQLKELEELAEAKKKKG